MDDATIDIFVDIDGTQMEWLVHTVTAVEAIDRPTRVTLLAQSRSWEDLDGQLGKPAAVRLRLEDDSERCFHGVLTDLRQEVHHGGGVVLHVSLDAPLAVLAIGKNSRIWLEKTVEEVVTEVLDEAALPHDVVWELRASYEPHEQITQLNESDYELIVRLLHEEGISFCTHSEETGAILRFFDDTSGVEPITIDPVLNCDTSGYRGEGGVRELREALRVASDQTSLRDYDLTSTAEDDAATGREVYLHPAGFQEAGRGDHLATMELERRRARCRTIAGLADHPRLEAGRRVTIQGTDRVDLAGDFILLSVTHELGRGGDGRYEARFEAAPLDVPQRPQTPRARPWQLGGHVGWVTGPAGEELHGNEYGRVRVRFPWDRSGITDDRSSTWHRVGQLALGGSMIIPRVGFEVAVDFELGDLDRPCVIGHLYNSEAPPPYALPGSKTRSSLQTATTGGGPGANELRFEDAAGSEEMFLNASKDYTVNTANDSNLSTLVDAVIDIGSNHQLGVTGNHSENVTGNRTLTVGANQNLDVTGNLADMVGGSCSIDIGGARMVKVGSDHVEQVSGSMTRSVGSLQSILGIGGFQRKVKGSSTVTVAAAHAELVGGSRAVDVKGSYTETIGALKFIKAKGVNVSCDAAYIVNAAAVQVKTGAGRTDTAKGAISLTAGGGIDIDASGNVTIAASSRLIIRGGGCTITLTSGGTAEVKAATVIVKNAESLNQIMHKSN